MNAKNGRGCFGICGFRLRGVYFQLQTIRQNCPCGICKTPRTDSVLLGIFVRFFGRFCCVCRAACMNAQKQQLQFVRFHKNAEMPPVFAENCLTFFENMTIILTRSRLCPERTIFGIQSVYCGSYITKSTCIGKMVFAVCSEDSRFACAPDAPRSDREYPA